MRLARAPPKVIGFSAPKQSGKTTAGRYLVEKWGYTIHSFATPLKKLCNEYFGLTPEETFGVDKETVNPQWGVSPRQIMQFVGTDMFREKLGELVGMDLASQFWIRQLVLSELSVIDDIRMLNELEYVRDHGGLLVKIKRLRSSSSTECHSTEQELPDDLFDVIIYNDGTLDELYGQLDKLLQ